MEEKVILLVEDNPDDVALTLRAFRKSPVPARVQVVHDGVEAVDYLLGTGPYAAERPPLPDLVLLDLNMPRMDGFEVLLQLRAEERTRLLPVVILTSSSEEQDLVKGYRHGANSYVRKPVDYSDFVEAACQLGIYWLGLNLPAPHGGKK